MDKWSLRTLNDLLQRILRQASMQIAKARWTHAAGDVRGQMTLTHYPCALVYNYKLVKSTKYALHCNLRAIIWACNWWSRHASISRGESQNPFKWPAGICSSCERRVEHWLNAGRKTQIVIELRGSHVPSRDISPSKALDALKVVGNHPHGRTILPLLC